MNLPPQPDNPFPTTQWTLVGRLRSADALVARRAVEDIFIAYRYPLYGFLRGSHMNHEYAEDVLQGFFEKLLRTGSLVDADPARGNCAPSCSPRSRASDPTGIAASTGDTSA